MSCAELLVLRHENAVLRRTNEILEAASASRPWNGLADVELGTAVGAPRPKAAGGSTGSTTSASAPPSETSRPTSTRPTTTLNTSPNRRLEATRGASTDPGAVQSGHTERQMYGRAGFRLLPHRILLN
ncbi:hypothetical protein [Streptomyces sp. NPDC050388]|uniref:hypothetical protein n=1 Tax=Streptomyces sp. NPDC050388 TaxID=3155781 RepID=UPI00343B95C8